VKQITWTLMPCPDHAEAIGKTMTATPEEISHARAGCTSCRIVVACTSCDWTSRHALWASATASERHHQESACRN
jgi:hypothetical protein